MRPFSLSGIVLTALTLLLAVTTCYAEGTNDEDLAKKLANPIADLMILPLQINYDSNIGASDDGERLIANFQPVLPFAVNDNWKLITRTIIPFVYQNDIVAGLGSQSGLGDINMSLFFSPNDTGKITLGFGPVMSFPTATDELLGSEKWSAGPAAILLTTQGSWTIGMQLNHLWSLAGDDDRSDVSSTLIQPFASYTVGAWTSSLNAECTYNHESDEWAIPLNFSLSKLVRWGRLPVSLMGGIGYWLESPDSGAEEFRFRFQIKFVLPK